MVWMGSSRMGRRSRVSMSMLLSNSKRSPGTFISRFMKAVGTPRRPVWVSLTDTPHSARNMKRVILLPQRLLKGTPASSKSRQPSRRLSGCSAMACMKRRMSAGECWPSESAVMAPGASGQVFRQKLKAVLRARPLPRFTAWRSTTQPHSCSARRNTGAYSGPLPSSTSTMFSMPASFIWPSRRGRRSSGSRLGMITGTALKSTIKKSSNPYYRATTARKTFSSTPMSTSAAASTMPRRQSPARHSALGRTSKSSGSTGRK